VKEVIIASLLSALIPMASAQAPLVSPSIKYKATPVKVDAMSKANVATIQRVQLEAAAGISKQAINRINVELVNVAKEFGKSASKCHDAALGHPWAYASKLEKILLTEKYVSLVFARETVCAGSPDFERDPIVFSVKDGSVVSADRLFKSEFPEEELLPNISQDKRLVAPSSNVIERLIAVSKIARNDYDEQCEHYLKNTSFNIWMESKGMIFFPEFLQTDSICQKEYLLAPLNDVP